MKDTMMSAEHTVTLNGHQLVDVGLIPDSNGRFSKNEKGHLSACLA